MLNIAVIGAGRIGHVHAKTIASHPDAKLAPPRNSPLSTVQPTPLTLTPFSLTKASTPSLLAPLLRYTFRTCWLPPRLARQCCARSPLLWT